MLVLVVVGGSHTSGDELSRLAETGLTAAEVTQRIADGAVNDVPAAPSRTIRQIIRANVFTRFNALIGSLFAVVVVCGAYRDALFGGVVIANTLIGIVQELRAKQTLDSLVIVERPEGHRGARRGGHAARRQRARARRRHRPERRPADRRRLGGADRHEPRDRRVDAHR